MVIQTSLDLFDYYVVSELQKKFITVPNTKWIYSPPELCFGFAKEQFGEEIFPLYNVFRSEPAVKADYGSLANYRGEVNINEERSMNFLHVVLNYQIDFFCNDMYDMNKSNIDYYKFQTDRTLTFDLTELDLGELVGNERYYETPILFEDPTQNHNIDDMFESGRYFRYTYVISMYGMVFDVIHPIKVKEFIYGIYHKDATEPNKLFEITTPIE